MNKTHKELKYVAQCAVIAALYVVGTYLSGALNLAYGPFQFRLSEVFCIFPVLTPAAIPGLTIGCIISNLASPFGIFDIVFGSIATFLAAITARALRNVRIKNFPVLSSLMPVIFNAVIVGIELTILLPSDNTKFLAFLIFAGQVALGEIVMCTGLGLPLFSAIKRTKLFNN